MIPTTTTFYLLLQIFWTRQMGFGI